MMLYLYLSPHQSRKEQVAGFGKSFVLAVQVLDLLIYRPCDLLKCFNNRVLRRNEQLTLYLRPGDRCKDSSAPNHVFFLKVSPELIRPFPFGLSLKPIQPRSVAIIVRCVPPKKVYRVVIS